MTTTTDVSEPMIATGPAARDDARPGVVKRTWRTTTRIALVVIGVLVGLFAAVNTRSVEVSWVFGDPLQTPLIVAIAVALVAGILIGWLTAALRHRRD